MKDRIFIHGGMGNQLFQYAFLMALQEKGREVGIIVSHDTGKSGLVLNDVFNLRLKLTLINKFNLKIRSGRLNKMISEFTQKHYHCYMGSTAIYDENVFHQPKGTLFYGYYQNERYFENVSKELRNQLRFPEHLMNPKTLQLLSSIDQTPNTISVHIRRGDYTNPTFFRMFGQYCQLDYYHKAIQYMRSYLTNPSFIFFSDDIEWVKENLPIENSIYVNHNHRKDAWQDMALMSHCKHHIIANSTFSWWGAWLNNHVDKIIVAPQQWSSYDDPHNSTIPPSWIRL